MIFPKLLACEYLVSRSLPVKVFCETIYLFGRTSKLYYTLKYLDSKDGSGKILIDFDFLALLLEISTSQLWRLLSKAKDQGLLRYYKKCRNTHLLKIYLASNYKVLKQHGFSKLGTFIKTRNVFTITSLKKQVIEALSYSGQFQAAEVVKRSLKTKHRKYLQDLSLDYLWDKEKDKIDHFTNLNKLAIKKHDKSGHAEVIEKNIDYPISLITKNKIFMGTTGIHYGTSQDTIAKKAGCSVSTVYRHQTNLNKKQVCLYHKDFTKLKEAWENQHGYIGTGIYGDIQLVPNKRATKDTNSPLLIRIPIPYASKGDRYIETEFSQNKFFSVLGSDRLFMAHTNYYQESSFKYNLGTSPTARKAYELMISLDLPSIPKLNKKGGFFSARGRRNGSGKIIKEVSKSQPCKAGQYQSKVQLTD